MIIKKNKVAISSTLMRLKDQTTTEISKRVHWGEKCCFPDNRLRRKTLLWGGCCQVTLLWQQDS